MQPVFWVRTPTVMVCLMYITIFYYYYLIHYDNIMYNQWAEQKQMVIGVTEEFHFYFIEK